MGHPHPPENKQEQEAKNPESDLRSPGHAMEPF